jgi:3-oxoadipate enol-lactonase
MIVLDGMRTAYRLEGPAGAPVVTLIHSLAATLELWDAQAAALRDRYRVLRYDVRGHGGSDAPPGPWSLDQMADDLRRLLDALGLARAHLVGLSMGGCVAMTAALRFPGLVESLVLADTTSRYAPHTRAMWDDRIRAVEAGGMEPVIEPTMDIWFTPEFRRRAPEAVDRVRRMFRATDPHGYVRAVGAIAEVDLTTRLGEIRAPTLVLVGEHDPGTPVAMAETLQRGIPGARLTVLPGARHCSCVEAAPAFDQALLGFLADLAA